MERKDERKEKTEEVLPYDPELQAQWRNHVKMPLHFQRIDHEEVVNLVNAAWPPTVFMREHLKTTDIVIRLPVSSRQLPDVDREIFFANFVPLKRVFDDLISQASAKKGGKIRSKLSADVYRAYKSTWLLLFQSLYLNQLDPRTAPSQAIDPPAIERPKWFLDMEKVFNIKRPSGRPRRDNQDRLQARLNLLVDHCETLHRKIIEDQVEQSTGTESRHVHVLRTFWRKILKIPGGISILGGEAFSTIPYENRDNHPKLEDPTSWKPRQLAIALLAFEQGQRYHTIERRFPLPKKQKR